MTAEAIGHRDVPLRVADSDGRGHPGRIPDSVLEISAAHRRAPVALTPAATERRGTRRRLTPRRARSCPRCHSRPSQTALVEALEAALARRCCLRRTALRAGRSPHGACRSCETRSRGRHRRCRRRARRAPARTAPDRSRTPARTDWDGPARWPPPTTRHSLVVRSAPPQPHAPAALSSGARGTGVTAPHGKKGYARGSRKSPDAGPRPRRAEPGVCVGARRRPRSRDWRRAG